MKKTFTAFLLLAVLFCFMACEPENDPKPPKQTVDATTLDGCYVQTIRMGGRPANIELTPFF